MFKSIYVLALTGAVVIGVASMTQKAEALPVGHVSEAFAVEAAVPTDGPSTVVGKLPLVTVNTIQSIVKSPTIAPTTTTKTTQTVNPTTTTQTINTTRSVSFVRVPQTGNPIVIFSRPDQ